MPLKKAEIAHYEALAAIGCIVCHNEGNPGSPCEMHHPRGHEFGSGAALKAANEDCLPLCPTHHRLGGYGVAFHAGKQAWEKRFGTQRELLTQVRELLEGK